MLRYIANRLTLLILILTFTSCADFDKPLIVMVRIPAGTFIMGSPVDEPGRDPDPVETQHQVTVSAFYMGKYPVTQKQWFEVMGTTQVQQQHEKTLGTDTDYYGRGDNYPIYFVNWYDAIVFCNKLSIKEGLEPVYSIIDSTDPEVWISNAGRIPFDTPNPDWNKAIMISGATGYRLPTEAEWEYACRADTTTAYNTGAKFSEETGWYDGNSAGKAQSVGKKQKNIWGLYDMHGNVYEWCWDWYDRYESGAQTNPTGPNSDTIPNSRVMRGGAWVYEAERMRSASREQNTLSLSSHYCGFRVARSQ